MENAKKILDECVYGLEDAKMQILQYIGQWISNPETTGTAIAIKGPPGTGKTTLIKEGISKILSRPFAFMALGGARVVLGGMSWLAIVSHLLLLQVGLSFTIVGVMSFRHARLQRES